MNDKDRAELHRQIQIAEENLALTPPGHPERGGRLHDLLRYLQQRWVDDKDPRDLVRGFGLAEEALSLAPAGHSDRPDRLQHLSFWLHERWRVDRDRSDLDRLIDLAEDALKPPPEDRSDRRELSWLRCWWKQRAGRRRSPRDLRQDTSSSHVDRPNQLHNLLCWLQERWQLDRDRADLHRAIETAEEALDLTPSGSPDRGDRLYHVWWWLDERWQLDRDRGDMDRSIDFAEEALDLAPAGRPDRGRRLSDLSYSLQQRWHLDRDRGDLDRGIDLAEEALDLAPSGHSDRGARLETLSWWLDERWQLDRDRGDMDRSIDLAEEALDLAPAGRPDRGRRLSDLSYSLQQRWHLDRDLGDLDRGIDLAEEALDLAPSGHSDRGARLETLSWWLEERWLVDRDRGDLDRGIDLAEEALDLAPSGSATRGTRLEVLSSWLEHVWLRTPEAAVFEKGTALIGEALELAVANDPFRPGRLTIAAWWSNEGRDFGRAVELMLEAVVLSPANDPVRPERMAMLVDYLKRCHQAGGGDALLDRVLGLLSFQVGIGLGASMMAGLAAGRELCRLAVETGRWEEAVRGAREGLGYARDALGELGTEGAGEALLGMVQGLASAGAYASCQTGDLGAAVQLLEQGSAVLLAVRSEISAERMLAAEMDCPGLVAAYREARARLRERAGDGDAFAAATVDLTRARRALEERIGDLAPEMDLGAVSTLAAEAGRPVVYLLATSVGGAVVTVDPVADPSAIFVDGLTEAAVTEKVENLRAVFENKSDENNVYPAAKAVKGVLAWLKELLPRVDERGAMVVAVGRVAQLPVTAAILDLAGCAVPVSVAPSARLHARAHESAGRKSQRGSILAVTDAHPCTSPDGLSLPRLSAAAEEGEELETVFGAEHLQGDNATRANVMSRLPDTWVVHLGVHGLVDPATPRRSRALLADEESGVAGELSVEELVRLGYAEVELGARLVFLGSCWLGASGDPLPDEAQGLPGSLVALGVGGVIAPLWPVFDQPSRHLAGVFYARWLKDGEPPALALAKAMLDTRRQWPRDPTWAAYGLTGS